MSKRTLLEANEELLLKEFLLPENAPPYEPEELNQILGEDSYSLVYPAPGVCVKTKTDTGEKVFINVCTSEKVWAARDLTEEKLLKIVFDQTLDSSYSLYISKERLESDKAGKPCLTYDAMINKEFFQICRVDKTLWIWMVQGILDAVSKKSGKPLNCEDFVVLKNLKVMGKLQPQKLETGKQPSPPRKPLIEEINIRPKDTDATAGRLPRNKFESSTSNFVILRHPREGTPTRLIGLFCLPKRVSAKALSVDVAPDRLIISHEKSKSSYDLFVPFNIDEEGSTGVLYRDEGLLRLDLPIQP